MPEEGFKTITISEETFNKLTKMAEDNHRSVPKQIEFLIDNSKKEA
jgi:predicted CopG family antitoxin